MSVTGHYRVWTCPNLFAFEFTEVTKCNIVNLRNEAKGLGACDIKIDLTLYSEDQKATFTNNSTVLSSIYDATAVGRYVFVQLVAYMSEEDYANPEYKLLVPWDESIVWFGYVSARSFEVQCNSNDSIGNLNCLGIGHMINKYQITYPHPVENGFNPTIDGVLLGNKKIVNDLPAFIKNQNEISIDTANIGNYWSVREVVDFMVRYGSPFQIGTSWIRLTDSMLVGEPNRWLEMYEAIDGYSGQDLTSALEAVLDTISWIYYWSEDDEELKIEFIDPVGNMTDAYIDSYVIPKAAKEFSILSEEQKFEKVVLKGDRILFGISNSTYGGKQSLKINKDWTDAEAIAFAQPPLIAFSFSSNLNSTVNININNIEENIKKTSEDVSDIPESAQESAKEKTKKQILNSLKAYREKTPYVYQHFTWGLCNPSSVTVSGDCLATSIQPGNWDNEKKIDAGTIENRVIPAFPYVKLQDVVVNSTDSTIDGAIYTDPKIDNAMTLHQTPPSSEFKFEDFVPWKPNLKENEWFNKPRFYYRTLGPAQEYGTTTVYDEAWQYGDMAGDGLMSSEFELDWKGIKLKSPQPESWGCGYPYIFHQGAIETDAYDTTVQKFGVQTNEWESNAALSDYDPYRVPYMHKGHWSRLIFSYAAYSKQYLEISFGESTSTDKIKFEEDDSLKLWIIRKGFVPYLDLTTGIGGEGTIVAKLPLPYYATEDIVTRNDLSIAKDRLKTLWNFWNKEKRAVRIVLPAYFPNGDVVDPGLEIGQFLDQVEDEGSNMTKWNVNSYVTSIEYLLDLNEPKIVITTEYPASPRRTRTRQLKSSTIKKRGEIIRAK
jgi:hypothetical protein